ncbi:hypothetical protein B1813_18930 [Saccharomonospora piscinae]|uniref:Uncharacterized protein n=1 Tax=Saccharomonospora piscinae TaxID=687388 RepID=A0A1V8ZYP5_SACPI|nr:hypothetical protein [Saccharomonospora piscinae]OQO89916.1 hypothetical protein B1813_18930 [Saccharomonospora piscinae]
MSEHVQTCVVCPHNPKHATGGALVCFDCSNRILRHLRELEDYLPTLPLIKARKTTERGSPGFRSTPPLDLTAVHHTDWRSAWDDTDGHGAIATLHSWARLVREDRGLEPPDTATLTSEAGVLRTQHQWIVCQPWADEYAHELRHLHGAVRAAAGDAVPRPVGRCIKVWPDRDCGGSVFELDDASGVKCASCGETYAGTSLIHLRLAQEAS